MKLRSSWEASGASEFFPIPFVRKVIDWFSGRKARLERVFNEMNVLFQEVMDEHLHRARPKAKQDDIIDVLLAISKKQVESCTVIITHENIKAIFFVSNFYFYYLIIFTLNFYFNF